MGLKWASILTHPHLWTMSGKRTKCCSSRFLAYLQKTSPDLSRGVGGVSNFQPMMLATLVSHWALHEMIKCMDQPLHPLVLNFIQHPVSLSPKHTLNDLQSQRNELLQLSDTGWAWQVWWSSSENSSPNNLLTRYVASMCIWGIGYPLVIHWLSIGYPLVIHWCFWDAWDRLDHGLVLNLAICVHVCLCRRQHRWLPGNFHTEDRHSVYPTATHPFSDSSGTLPKPY